MDKLLETLNNFLTVAGQAISAHAPKVWDATLHLIFWNGLLSLVGNLLWVGILILLWVWPWRKLYKWNVEDKWDTEPAIAALIISAIALVIFDCVVFFSMSWLYYVICVVDPQLGVIYALAQKAGII